MGILSLFSVLGNFFHIYHLADKALIDNGVFRAHYKLTVALFFGCSLLVTAYSFIGKCYSVFFDHDACDFFGFGLFTRNSNRLDNTKGRRVFLFLSMLNFFVYLFIYITIGRKLRKAGKFNFVLLIYDFP